jgi:hydroxyacylglutathione hydrolase
MKWTRIPLGALQTNCYFLENNHQCVVIDPGAESEKLIEYLKINELTPLAILLTHAHFDHIGAVDALRDYFSIPVYVHEKEAKWLFDPSLNGSQFFFPENVIRVKPADYILTKEETVTVGPFTLEVLETPGHSPGSVSYTVQEAGIVFAGDVLFYQSIGRTDLPGGNHKQLLETIHEKLLTLPEETVVLPGHGVETTIQDEMDHNPFIHGF